VGGTGVGVGGTAVGVGGTAVGVGGIGVGVGGTGVGVGTSGVTVGDGLGPQPFKARERMVKRRNSIVAFLIVPLYSAG